MKSIKKIKKKNLMEGGISGQPLKPSLGLSLLLGGGAPSFPIG